ncbi:major facilitator superfamily domain-containing protein [Geopyxis carbonaria]|nr:major facilitator superfamily domain-containing protein [Geopyxis carbonaria]
MAPAPSTSSSSKPPSLSGDTPATPPDALSLHPIPSELPAPLSDPPADIPPDGGYGWVCVFALFFINSSTWGINSSYGVFLAHYLSTDAFPGATPLHYAFIGGLSTSTSMVIGPLVTFSLRHASTRAVMALGLAMEVGALIAASFATQIWHLFLTQGVLFGAGMGFLFTASIGAISQWFSAKRSVANGITAAGSGIGGLAYSLGIRAIIARHGLAWAFRAVALCALVVNAACTALLRDRNKHVRPHQRAFDVALLRRWSVALVLAWGFFSMLGYIVILFSLPDYARSRGFSATQGSVLGALLNLGMAFGRPLVGLASDRWGRINVGGLMTAVTAVSCFAIWIPARSFGVAVLFSLINGAVCGTFWTTIAPVAVEVVGIRELPSALSLVWMSVVLPTTFAEPIALYLREPGAENPYLHPQVFSGMMYVAAAITMWLLRAWKLGENDRKLEEENRESGKGDGPPAVAPSGFLDRWKAGSKWWRYGWV